LATPYAPSQLALANYDATQSATATWVFSSSDSTVTQGSFDLQVYNNATNALVFDTGWVTSTNSQYTIPANTLVNRTVYKWRVQYKDNLGNASAWSSYQTFTCSSLPTTSISSPTASQTLASNVVTVNFSYSQAQSVTEQSYRLVIFASDQQTIAYDSGTIYNTANTFTVSGIPNGTYYAQSTVTSADGLTSSSGKVQFTIAYNGLASSPSITATPLPTQASIRIDWSVPTSIPGTYVGTGATYRTGKFGQAIQVAAYGEKVYWTSAPFTQFTYTSWWLPNLSSANMKSNQVIARIQADSSNYIQMKYDPVSQAFFMEQSIAGNVVVTKSQTGLTFNSGDQLFVAIRQSATLDAFVGVGGSIYKFSVNANATGTTNTFGQAKYGSGTYANNVSNKQTSYTTTYIGCSPNNGREANALFDQTGLTLNIMSDSTIQSLYTNSTQQQFTIQNMFLANFDGNLEGGTAGSVPIDHWNVYRLYNGTQKLLGTISNTNQNTASYTDTTPLSNITYQYNIVPVDSNGNIGSQQSVQATVTFDGWWLTDLITNVSFQFNYNVEDTSIKKNYKRTLYETFGQYPIIAYSPMNYREGKLVGLILDLTNTKTPLQLYQTLISMIDAHHQLVLRGTDGTGIVVDCYDLTRTIQMANALNFNKVEVSWTEVAALV
jgi:hypothetical protein